MFEAFVLCDDTCATLCARTDYWMDEGFKIMQLCDFVQHCSEAPAIACSVFLQVRFHPGQSRKRVKPIM